MISGRVRWPAFECLSAIGKLEETSVGGVGLIPGQLSPSPTHLWKEAPRFQWVRADGPLQILLNK